MPRTDRPRPTTSVWRRKPVSDMTEESGGSGLFRTLGLWRLTAIGVGGIVGAILTGVFATAAINPAGENASLLNQIIGLGAVMAWSAIGTFVILMICKYTVGLRVTKESEIEGLDYTQHGESIHQ